MSASLTLYLVYFHIQEHSCQRYTIGKAVLIVLSDEILKCCLTQPRLSCLQILRFNIDNLFSNFLETFTEIEVAIKIQGTQYLLLCRIIVMIYTVFVEICLALLRPANDSFLFLKLTKLSHLLLSTGTDFLGIGTCSIIGLTLRELP